MKIIDKIEMLSDTKFLKEDLERYYIDERKSLIEISRIYGCSPPTVKNKLEKYEIPTRLHGSSLVSDDGKTLNSKYTTGEISRSEYENERVKSNGYKNINDYNQKTNHIKGVGTGMSMNENKNCPSYLGVYICENKEFLSKIINIVESMPNNNPGYDIVCAKDKKIDVKCSCLIHDKSWGFHIRYNKKADYFLMIAFDNRDDLNVMHIWLVKDDDVIEKTTWNSKEFIVNEVDTIAINKGNKGLERWIKYEKTDLLEKAQKICNEFKNDDKRS